MVSSWSPTSHCGGVTTSERQIGLCGSDSGTGTDWIPVADLGGVNFFEFFNEDNVKLLDPEGSASNSKKKHPLFLAAIFFIYCTLKTAAGGPSQTFCTSD